MTRMRFIALVRRLFLGYFHEILYTSGDCDDFACRRISTYRSSGKTQSIFVQVGSFMHKWIMTHSHEGATLNLTPEQSASLLNAKRGEIADIADALGLNYNT